MVLGVLLTYKLSSHYHRNYIVVDLCQHECCLVLQLKERTKCTF